MTTSGAIAAVSSTLSISSRRNDEYPEAVDARAAHSVPQRNAVNPTLRGEGRGTFPCRRPGWLPTRLHRPGGGRGRRLQRPRRGRRDRLDAPSTRARACERNAAERGDGGAVRKGGGLLAWLWRID